MKNSPRSGHSFLAPLAGTVLLAAFLSVAAPARANGSVEPFTLLSEPNSAGLGAIVRFEASPYREGGTRYDISPLYLFEGERLFLDANRAGVKLLKGGDQRLDLFAAQRLEGLGQFVEVGQRVGPVDQQQVEVVGAQGLQ